MRPSEKGRPRAEAASQEIESVAQSKTRIRRRRTPPNAYASVYAPDATRALWHVAYKCPFCARHHFGRARTEAEVTGVRTSRCGRLVTVVAARVYRDRSTGEAA
jgi:hypothetical protein